LNLAANSTIFIVTITLGFWMKADNKNRDIKSRSAQMELEQWGEKQIQDMDWKHPDFRWRS